MSTDKPAVDWQGTHIARVRLDWPPGNRFTLARLQSLYETLEALAEEGTLRCVQLVAAGDDFSHGADLADPGVAERMQQPDGLREAGLEIGSLGQRLIDRWRDMPVPTVISVRGHVIGAGACLFAAADFRIATAGAQIQFPEVDRGMYLSWGILPDLVHEFGPALARRLAVAGEMLPVSQLPPGVVSIVDDDADRAGAALAGELAAKPPLAVREILQVLHALTRGDDSAVREDAQRLADSFASEDFLEAISAWMEKRTPQYRGR